MNERPPQPADPPTDDPVDRDPILGDQITATIGDNARNVIVGKDIQVTITEIKSLEDQPPTPGAPPYKGLAFYDQADEQIFFGRRARAQTLVELITAHAFVAVVGGSGSGKSSLVRAAVLPALKRLGWHTLIIRPNIQPLHELAHVLNIADAPSAHTSESLLAAATTLAASAPAQRLALVIDQFEELFTLAKDDAINQTFVATLLAARSHPALRVVIIVRADFYHRLAQFADLPAAVAERQIYLTAMTPAQLAEVILQPLQQHSWRIQAGLAESILDDVGHEPGSLPFLSHALLETWQRRRSNVLTLSGYRETGGVKGAIAATAEEVWHDFTASEQTAVRAILIELTELGERDGDQQRTPDTRRRRTYADLAALALPQADLDAVLEALVRRRLLTRDHDQIEVAHEALIRAWPRLQAWLDADRTRLRLQRQLQADAHRWQATGSPDDLYRGARLAGAQEWTQAQSTAPAGLIAEFLQASQTAEDAERRQELEQAQALAAEQGARAQAETNRARTFRWAAIIASVLLVIALIISFIAYDRQRAAVASEATAQAQSTRADQQAVAANQARATSDINAALAITRSLEAQAAQATAQAEAANAQTQSQIAATRAAEADLAARLAHSRALASTSQAAGTTEPMRAWLLAIEAGRLVDTEQAFTIINQQDQVIGRPLIALTHDGFVYNAAWSGDESRILSWSSDGTVRVWDAASGGLLLTLAHNGPVLGAAWNKEESRILSWGSGGTVRVWDANSGDLLLTLTHDGTVDGAAWNEDESRILSWGGGTVRVWDANSGDLLLTLAHDGNVTGAVWNEDESGILSWSGDGTVRVWDANSGDLLHTLAHDGPVDGAAWNRDESRILSWSGDRTMQMWDMQTGLILQTFFGDDSSVSSAQWNQAETQIMLTTAGGKVYRYYTWMEDLLTAACTRATRNLTWSEWQQYLPGEPYRLTCPNLPPHPSVPASVLTSPAATPTESSIRTSTPRP